MRSTTIVLLAALFLAPTAHAQSVAETAGEVLTAYKNRDLAGVKKYTAPMIAAAMDDKFFEDKEIKAGVEALQSWDGKVKEVRYSKSRMGVMASAHYDDADKDTYRALALINAGYGWKQMGLAAVSKKKFLSYDKKEPKIKADSKAEAGDKPGKGALAGAALKDQLGGLGFGFGKKKSKPAQKEEQAPAAADKAAGGYSVEMADGTTADAPGDGQLKEMLGTLSSDNFFLTLTGPSGFMQAAYTAKGLDMQYKDASGHFAGEAAVPAETAAAMFKAYLAGETGWKAQCKWKPFK